MILRAVAFLLLLRACVLGAQGIGGGPYAPGGDGGALGAVASAAAADHNALDDQSKMIVDRITVRFEGPQHVSEDAVMAHVKVRKNMAFDQHNLDSSIRSLYGTGLYDFVEAYKTLPSPGKMDIEFFLIPKYRISQIIFSGNSEFGAARLQRQISSYSGGPLDDREVKRDVDKIVKYYKDKGYSLAKVSYAIEKNDTNGTGVVRFDVDEGQDVTIENIYFTGNSHIEADVLLDEMKTGTWMFLISHITDIGRFNEDDFQSDLEKLRQYYRNEGYLDVEIDESKVKLDFPDPDEPGEMDITIPISEGKQYNIGKTTFRNNKLFKTEVLDEFVSYNKLSAGNVFSPKRVDTLVEDIKDYYGQYGYIETIVRALRRPNLETGQIDLIIDIIESDKYYVESINIQGNTKTKSEVIIRELALEPGDIFDYVRMKASENRLKNTRFFDEVTISPEVTSIPNRRNMRIIVKEARTGNLTFGAGFSTVESFVATAELSQSNFDYQNYDSWFQGAGQKFRIRASIGDESSQVIIGFEEPWIFNREIAFGFELFRTDTGYYSDEYSELRTGMTFYIRKYLFEHVEGRLGYTVEDVNIYDVTSNAPWPIAKEEGHRSISEINLSFLRDTRDNAMTPTKGTRFEIVQAVAGGPLMGQTNLYRVEGRAGAWFRMWEYIPACKFANQVFSLVGRTGSVMGYGGKEVPFFERYFLGGAYNMRGFKYRKVGPIENGEPVGGNSFGYISAEYSFQVIEPLRIALFYDIGFVNADSWDFDPSEYNDDFGIGFRINLMGAPMRIDIGMPITHGKDNDDGIQFNFSFGSVF